MMRLTKNGRRFSIPLAALATMPLVLPLACGMSRVRDPISPIEMKLPEPRLGGDMAVEQALLQRRSVRDYTGEPLTWAEVSQLLWAAQGITGPGRGFRTAPSAGATFPLETYLVVGSVAEAVPGIYRYEPDRHKLVKVRAGDARPDLAAAALDQTWVRHGNVSIVLAAVFERTTARYGERGERYVHMEVGHAAQNISLQGVALGLGMVVVGAFDDERVSKILGLPQNQKALCIIPVGKIE